jgi:hypothetical protein
LVRRYRWFSESILTSIRTLWWVRWTPSITFSQKTEVIQISPLQKIPLVSSPKPISGPQTSLYLRVAPPPLQTALIKHTAKPKSATPDFAPSTPPTIPPTITISIYPVKIFSKPRSRHRSLARRTHAMKNPTCSAAPARGWK